MVLKGLSVYFKPVEYVSDFNILRVSLGKPRFRDGPVINKTTMSSIEIPYLNILHVHHVLEIMSYNVLNTNNSSDLYQT